MLESLFRSWITKIQAPRRESLIAIDLLSATVLMYPWMYHSILCCNCGAPIDGTTAAEALCSDCLRLDVDASAG